MATFPAPTATTDHDISTTGNTAPPHHTPPPRPRGPQARTGTFAGTQLRLIDWNGTFRSPVKVVEDRITGDIAVSADGTLTWAYVPATPSCAKPLTGASPTSTPLRVARLKP